LSIYLKPFLKKYLPPKKKLPQKLQMFLFLVHNLGLASAELNANILITSGRNNTVFKEYPHIPALPASQKCLWPVL